MPWKLNKPPPHIAAANDEVQRALRSSEEAILKMEVDVRRVAELLRARAKHPVAPTQLPVEPSKVPALATKLNQSLVAMTNELARTRTARAAPGQSPGNFAGGDESRVAHVAHLIHEMKLVADAFKQDYQLLGDRAERYEEEAMAAIEAGDDDRARVALWCRRGCLDDRELLRREVNLVQRICGEYERILRALRQIADT